MTLILGTNSIKDTGGYQVDNSCRFDGTSSYMTKTLGTPTSAKKGTISYWFKQGSVNTGVIKTAFSFGSEYGAINYDTGSTKGFEINLSNGNGWYKGTNEGFTARDPSAWWHLMVVVDTTQGTESNRFKFYMNGSQITFTSGNNFPSSNGDIPGWASGQVMQVGRRSTTSNKYFDGYMAEVVFIDGYALSPSDFGEYDSDSPTIWKPKDVSGLTFGNNGFYLDFKDSSNLGNDANGGTDLTETGLDATNQAIDTPTNNFCVMNSLENYYQSATLTEGNLKLLTATTSNVAPSLSTFALTKGKWYLEAKYVSDSLAVSAGAIGVEGTQVISATDALLEGTQSFGLYLNDGKIWSNNSNSAGSLGSHIDHTATIGFSLDLDNNRITFSKNGQWGDGSGNWDEANPTAFRSITDPASVDFRAYHIAFGDWSSGSIGYEINFGSPIYAISSSNQDGNGLGNFEYSVPADHYCICTKNIAEFG